MMSLNQLSKTPTNNTTFTGKCREQIYSFYFLAKSIHYTQFFYNVMLDAPSRIDNVQMDELFLKSTAPIIEK